MYYNQIMSLNSSKKAENVRDVIRYLEKFKNALVVIYLDDKTIASPLFSSHIRDIALLHQAGLKVVIIPGARTRIDEVLSAAKIEWSFKDNIRVTTEDAMPLVKMAAFDVSNSVMTSLAANNITAVIGNWVRSRSKGIIDGFDYGIAGEIDRLDIESLQTVLNDGFIPIFPCIGWNAVGHPYNITSTNLAQQVAINLNADKLFFVMEDGGVKKENNCIRETFTTDENGIIAAMSIEDAQYFVEQNKNTEKQSFLIELGIEACKNGVVRTHIVDGNIDGVLLTEIFSDFGSGTMLYTNNYGKIRSMEQTDIPSVLAVMNPFIESGKLLPRNHAEIAANLNDYVVYELDGGVHACGALHTYADGQAEIAAVAVDEAYNNMGIGPKIIEQLLEKAKSLKVKSVFILTTQASDWFEKMGFTEDKIESIPEERRAKWTVKRNSQVYRIKK